MSLSITDLKKGTIFELDGVPYKVIDYSQKVMGRGGSIVNVKIKGLADGKVLDKTFKGNERLEAADITGVSAQFLYDDGNSCHFMDSQTFEQFEVNNPLVGQQKAFLKEGQKVTIQLFKNRPVTVELPKNVDLKVEYTEDAIKGDTSSAVTKDAEVETGTNIKVPAFIKTGDIISVDSESGAYRARTKAL